MVERPRRPAAPFHGRVAIGQIPFVINLAAAIGFLVLGSRSVLLLST